MACHKVSTNDNNDIAIYGLQISKSNSIMNLTDKIIRGNYFQLPCSKYLGKNHQRYHRTGITMYLASQLGMPGHAFQPISSLAAASIFIDCACPRHAFAAILASYPILASAKKHHHVLAKHTKLNILIFKNCACLQHLPLLALLK